MVTVTGVRFRKSGKVYYFNPERVWPKPGDAVVVETIRGLEIGEAVTGAREVGDDQIVAPLKHIVRLATEADLRQAEAANALEAEAYKECQAKIIEHKLEMKLIETEIAFDCSKIIFFFTANSRIDFRDLVKDLTSKYKTRIELRQVGVRDEAKMLGGLGACGRSLCCGTFLSDFQPVSIKMAKEQNLSLNPTKISGQCGRLMCCLKYEQAFYESIIKKLPRIGRDVVTPDGVGALLDINALKESVKVRVRFADGSYDVRTYGVDDVQRVNPTQKPADRDGEAEPEEKAVERPSPPPEPVKRAAPRRARGKANKQSTESYFLKTGEADGAVPDAREGETP